MKVNYITIEREYGSGGEMVARRLSELCDTPCYGREILEMVSKEHNIPVQKVEHYEETVTGSFLYSMFLMSQVQSGSVDMLSTEGHIYVAEQLAIQKLANKGSAIFLGHCASEALRNRPGVVKVFIRADVSKRQERIIDEYGIPKEDVESLIKRYDKKRANYYYANTTKKWDNLKNYDIVLDSGTLGIDGCVNVLKGLLVKQSY